MCVNMWVYTGVYVDLSQALPLHCIIVSTSMLQSPAGTLRHILTVFIFLHKAFQLKTVSPSINLAPLSPCFFSGSDHGWKDEEWLLRVFLGGKLWVISSDHICNTVLQWSVSVHLFTAGLGSEGFRKHWKHPVITGLYTFLKSICSRSCGVSLRMEKSVGRTEITQLWDGCDIYGPQRFPADSSTRTTWGLHFRAGVTPQTSQHHSSEAKTANSDTDPKTIWFVQLWSTRVTLKLQYNH